jgi:GR25 family glycosyltransferase involved in LPS biosynthesis
MSNPLDFFDAIYCINLDERTDRWEHCLVEFEKLGISDRVIRFSAIKPKHDERWNRCTKWGNRWKYPLVGAVGCAESHKAIIELAKENNLNNVLVLEDDFVVCENWKHNLETAIKELQGRNWHIFYLGYRLANTWNMIRKLGEVLRRIISKRKRGIHLTVGLAYNSSKFDYLIENIDSFNHRSFGREGHIDKFFARNKHLRKYFVEPMVVRPNLEFESDIS